MVNQIIDHESQFEALLDVNKHDWPTRLIYADWLEDVEAGGHNADRG